MSQAARLFHVCRRLSEGETVTVASLEEQLEVTRATVFRDIAVLRDQLNAPVVWDAENETYRLESQEGAHARFMLPGMWMEAEQLYGMLTVLNLASALDPGIAGRYREEYRSFLKSSMRRLGIVGYGLDQKIAVELSGPGHDAQAAMDVIGPALMLDTPIRLFVKGPVEKTGQLVIPGRLLLRGDGWWLEYKPQNSEIATSVALADVASALPVDTVQS